MSDICGIVSLSGPNREPLACAWLPGHQGDHSWSTLPTFPIAALTGVGEITSERDRRFTFEGVEQFVGINPDDFRLPEVTNE